MKRRLSPLETLTKETAKQIIGVLKNRRVKNEEAANLILSIMRKVGDATLFQCWSGAHGKVSATRPMHQWELRGLSSADEYICHLTEWLETPVPPSTDLEYNCGEFYFSREIVLEIFKDHHDNVDNVEEWWVKLPDSKKLARRKVVEITERMVTFKVGTEFERFALSDVDLVEQVNV